MRTGVLVLAILAAVASLSIGLCSGACVSGLGSLGNAGDAAKADAFGVDLAVYAFVEFILALIGGIVSYRNWISRKATIIAGIIMLIGAGFSITNTFQVLTSGVLLLVATILSFIGGGKMPKKAND